MTTMTAAKKETRGNTRYMAELALMIAIICLWYYQSGAVFWHECNGGDASEH